jgi:hypothetical protein
VSQIPFISWLAVGAPLRAAFNAVSVPLGTLLFRRTGLQFFLADADTAGQPGALPIGRAGGRMACRWLFGLLRDMQERVLLCHHLLSCVRLTSLERLEEVVNIQKGRQNANSCPWVIMGPALVSVSMKLTS